MSYIVGLLMGFLIGVMWVRIGNRTKEEQKLYRTYLGRPRYRKEDIEEIDCSCYPIG